MRLFTKIFLFGMLVFSLAFSVSGYFLLHYSLESSMARETDFALKQYQYDKFTVQSAMLSYLDISIIFAFEENELPANDQSFTIWQTFPETPLSDGVDENGLFRALAEELNAPAAFFAEDHTLLFSSFQEFDLSFLDDLSEDTHNYRFYDTPEGSFILVGSMLTRSSLPSLSERSEAALSAAMEEQRFFFVSRWDISKTISQQHTLQQYFMRCYLTAMAAATLLLALLSALLTGPLKRMSGAARRMTEGFYEERLPLSGGDELGDLADSFNHMAEAVEEKIHALAKAAREKEDFVANFAHELKTPLTSIIGYADTIYQKDLPRKEVRRAAWHIWNEGMRLESLSLKLMELTVLGRQDFPLTRMPAEELLRDMAESLSPLFPRRQVELCLRTEPAYVRADYDLLKTLLLNLVDNSMKAGCSRIEVTGKSMDGLYWIHVKDNGCGMEKEELSRITEAFYMVDKARSRRQHGAGLGLALAERIARIHGSSLFFQSQKGAGTDVSFCLDCK